MVGLSMAATIAICVGGFVGIYGRLAPLASDFTGVDAPVNTPRPVRTRVAATGNGAAANATVGSTVEVSDAAAPTATAAAAPTPTPDAFVATHLSNSENSLNFRSEPSRNGGQETVIRVLDAGTPLRSLGREEIDEIGENWLNFATEDGEEGWIREFDAEPIESTP